MARREYDPEVKAAVMAALLAGQSQRQIEQETGVPKSTIADWSKELPGMIPGVPGAKKDEIGALLIDLLIAKIKSQIALSEHAADKNWLKTQDASAVAMLLGVSDDKLIRMLEKFESARTEPESAAS